MFRSKLLKFAVISAATLFGVVVIASGAVYVLSQHRLHQTFSVQARAISIPTDAAAVERGHHIVVTRGCGDCHGSDFGGHKIIDNAAAGLVYGPNITHGVGGLPADYSDMDYVRAIRHGISREGRPYFLMPSAEYTSISDEDLGAIIAYIKTVAPVDRPRGPIALGPLMRTLLVAGQVKLAATEIDHNAARPASVARTITPEYGKYLALGCTGCHGPNLSGGKIPGAPPDWPAAANLTSDPSGRLAHWSEQDFLNTVRTRKRPDGTEVNPVMPASVGALTDDELKALWLYIKTLPAASTGVRANATGN